MLTVLMQQDPTFGTLDSILRAIMMVSKTLYTYGIDQYIYSIKRYLGDILHRFRRSDGGSSHAIHYVLQQDDVDDIRRGYVGFHWAFEGGCRLLQVPAKVHVEDTI